MSRKIKDSKKRSYVICNTCFVVEGFVSLFGPRQYVYKRNKFFGKKTSSRLIESAEFDWSWWIKKQRLKK